MTASLPTNINARLIRPTSDKEPRGEAAKGCGVCPRAAGAQKYKQADAEMRAKVKRLAA
jgi:hypothetical protein